MPAAVQTPRFQQLLAKIFGLRESRSFDVEDIILPVVDVLDASAPELAHNRGELLAAGQADQVIAVAAQYGFVALENPVGSNCLLIVETFVTPTTQVTNMGLLNSTGLGISVGARKTPRDSRGWMQSSVVIGDIRSGTDAINPLLAGNGFGELFPTASGGQARYAINYVVPPGWSLVAKGSGVNSAYGPVGFSWRVKPVEREELT